MPVTTSVDAVDVLVVHHLALGLADPLRDHLLRGLRGDAAEVLGRDVGPLDLVLGHLGPVDVEVLVGDEHVRALAVLGLGRLELGEHALARLLEQPLLDVRRELDREDAEVALARSSSTTAWRDAPGVFLYAASSASSSAAISVSPSIPCLARARGRAR